MADLEAIEDIESLLQFGTDYRSSELVDLGELSCPSPPNCPECPGVDQVATEARKRFRRKFNTGFGP